MAMCCATRTGPHRMEFLVSRSEIEIIHVDPLWVCFHSMKTERMTERNLDTPTVLERKMVMRWMEAQVFICSKPNTPEAAMDTCEKQTEPVKSGIKRGSI